MVFYIVHRRTNLYEEESRSRLAISDQSGPKQVYMTLPSVQPFGRLPSRVSPTQNSPLALFIIVIRFISCPSHARPDEICKHGESKFQSMSPRRNAKIRAAKAAPCPRPTKWPIDRRMTR